MVVPVVIFVTVVVVKVVLVDLDEDDAEVAADDGARESALVITLDTMFETRDEN